MEIGDSARKHGVADEDIVHAIRFQTYQVFETDAFTMLLGPARDGRFLEVGVVLLDEDPYVIHAMPVRHNYRKYLR